MASVHKVVLANGTRWRARYRTPEGGSRTRTFDRKVDAEAFLATTEHQKLTGAYIDRSASAITFEVFAEEWREAQVHRPSTAAQVEGNLRRHVYPAIGKMPLGQIRTSTIQGFVKTLSADLAPGTVEVIYRYVSAIFKAAVADRMIASSPCVRVRLPKAPPTKIVPITVEQVRTLEGALPARYRALVPLCAGTGLRQGEAFGLTADRVDFLRRTLVVDRQLVLLPSTGPTFGPPKTPSSYRTIPVADVVLEALAAHIAEHGLGDEGLLFTNTVGGPIRRTRFSEAWRPAARAAGLPEGTGTHALRHFFASSLIAAGCSVVSVQERLGHASANETLDTYAHLWPDDDDRTRAAVDAVLGASERVTSVSRPEAL